MRSKAIEDALSVLTLDRRIRAYLQANDPWALKQAEDALATPDTLPQHPTGGAWPPRGYELEETASIYVEPTERFVVSLIVGYSFRDDIVKAEEAADAALRLVTGEGAPGTRWFVYDREHKSMRTFAQREFDTEAN